MVSAVSSGRPGASAGEALAAFQARGATQDCRSERVGASAGDRDGIWLISDGNPGEYNQSLALAQSLAGEGYGPVAWVSARPIRGLLRKPWAWLLDATRDPLPRFLEAVFVDGQLPPGRPRLIISSGGKTAHANVAVSRRCNAPNVFIGTPPGISACHFSAIMHTEEHWSPDNGVQLDLLPTRLSHLEAQLNGKVHRAELGIEDERICAMLIGGNSRTHVYRDDDWKALAKSMNHLARTNRFKWLVTSSRRTGPDAEAILRSMLDPAFIADATWWGIEPRPVVLMYLSVSDVAFCTQDSRTMLSEAIASGKPAYALFPDTVDYLGVEQGFSRRFLEQNASAGRIRRVPISQAIRIDIEGDLEDYFITVTTDVMRETTKRLLGLLENDRRGIRPLTPLLSQPLVLTPGAVLSFGSAPVDASGAPLSKASK